MVIKVKFRKVISMNYTFVSKDGFCPSCVALGKRWFIKDRYIGGEKYEYALMSRSLEEKVPIHFTNIKMMVSNLVGLEITDEIAVNLLLSQITEYQCSSYRMIEYNDIKYIWNDERNELREYTEPKQETGYCSTYLECLYMAKEILKKREQEVSGTRMNLFS